MAERSYQAVGALAGRLVGEEIELLDGQRFQATPSPVLRAWINRHPDQADAVRIWLAYPRTTKLSADGKSGGLHFYVVGTPEDQADLRWTSQIDRFNIKGHCIVSRAGKDNTVVWIPRNDAPPLGKRRHPDWKGHVLFLRRSLRPVRKWKATDIWVEAKRVGRELVIVSYQGLQHHQTTLKLPTGWEVPWPFRATRSSISALLGATLAQHHLVPSTVYRRGPDGKPLPAAEWVQAYDYRPWLRKLLKTFNTLQGFVATDLLPRQAQYEGQPLDEREIARAAEDAHNWGRFFASVLKYLDGLEPGQLVAFSSNCDPPAALSIPVIDQIKTWFTLTTSPTGQPQIWFEGAPVPHRVRKVVLPLLLDLQPVEPTTTPAPWVPGPRLKARLEQLQPVEPATVDPTNNNPGPAPVLAPLPVPVVAPKPVEADVRAYFIGLGAPATYSNRQITAWVVQQLSAEGYSDQWIAAFCRLLYLELAELKRVELPK